MSMAGVRILAHPHKVFKLCQPAIGIVSYKHCLYDRCIRGHQSRSMAQYIERHGSVKMILENARSNSVFVTASADFIMKSGLGKDIMYTLSSFDDLRLTEPEPGSVVVCHHYRHFIYFLVTRRRWFEKGSYQNLWNALMTLRTHCDENSVHKLLTGRLGDEDGFEFDKVKELISRIFDDTNKTFTIYSEFAHEDTYIDTFDKIQKVSTV